MHWILLYGAIALEVAGTTALKLSEGMQRMGMFLTSIGLYIVCFVLFAVALRSLPVSIAYAIWSGLGTVLVAVVGMVGFKEPLTALKGVYIVLIVIGSVGLNLVQEPG